MGLPSIKKVKYVTITKVHLHVHVIVGTICTVVIVIAPMLSNVTSHMRVQSTQIAIIPLDLTGVPVMKGITRALHQTVRI